MLVILFVVAVLSAGVASALNLTSSLSRNVNRSHRYRQALSIGDGALDYLFGHWHVQARANSNTQLTAQDLNAFPLPAAALFPGVDNFSASKDPDTADNLLISNLRFEGLDPSWDNIGKPVLDDRVPPPAFGMNEGTRSYFYLAKADVTLRNINGQPVKVKARRVLEKEIGSPWMYAIFYTDLLEIHPGPEFHVTGWVHTNDKLYTAHDELWFESKVTHVKGHEIRFAPEDNAHPGETPENPHTAIPVRPEAIQAPMGMTDKGFNPPPDTNSENDDGYRELIEPPGTGAELPQIESQRYYNQADVRVVVNGNTVEIFQKGKDLPLKVDPADPLGSAIFNVFKGAVSVGARIQDNREGASMRLTTLDMSKINAAMESGGPLHKKLNQVVYVIDKTKNDPATGLPTRAAVRLNNGGKMPPGGLTLASDNPVYIQGDYNTGTQGTLKPDSNLPNGDPTRNTVPGYTKQSCAVLGDAVMILSNAWNDSNSTKALAERVASPTTVNAAIVSGIVPTGSNPDPNGKDYSGGAENFPRFLEKWGPNTTFTYHGSMVQLYKSAYNKGLWGQPNVYDPPKRKWFFDRQFYTDPPPGTLSLISFKKSRWYQE
jgi:hypothetical protein